MAILLRDDDLNNLLAFYKDPTYERLAMFNSVLGQIGRTKTAADISTENNLFTDMIMTLKG